MASNVTKAKSLWLILNLMYFLINLWEEIPVSRTNYLNIIIFASVQFDINAFGRHCVYVKVGSARESLLAVHGMGAT